MPRLSAEPIVTTAAEEQVLTRLVRAHTTPRKLAERARMILLAAACPGVRDIARSARRLAEDGSALAASLA